MNALDVFDANFVREQLNLPETLSRERVYQRYLLQDKITVHPHRALDAEWYRRNRAKLGKNACVLEHYLAKSKKRSIDPAPWIDAVLFRRQFDHEISGAELLDLALRPHWRAEHGVTAGPSDLARVQRNFHESIDLRVVRSPSPVEKRRRRLVWVQHGPGSKFLNWFDNQADRSWDLTMNWYRGDPDINVGECVLQQAGTKFTGIAAVIRRDPNFFDGYEHILFIDDDLEFDISAIDRLFDVALQHEFDLFQASVAQGSHCSWPSLFHKDRSGFRRMSNIEIMAPGFSQKALQRLSPYFALSVSGYGLDLLAGPIIREAGGNVAVVDSVQMRHESKINRAKGSYYEFLRRAGINPNYESWILRKKLEKFEKIIEIS